MTSNDLEQKNTKLVRKLVLIVLGMFGFGYALVPLYDVFCDITGTGVNVKEVSEAVVASEKYEVDLTREITIDTTKPISLWRSRNG